MSNQYGNQYPPHNPQQPSGYPGHGQGPQGYQHGQQPGPHQGQPFGQPSPYYAMPQNDKSNSGCLAGLVVVFTALLPLIMLVIGVLVVVGFAFFAVMYADSETDGGITSSTSVSTTSVSATSTSVTSTPTSGPSPRDAEGSFDAPDPSGSPGYIR